MGNRLATLCALCLAAFGLAADETCVRDARAQVLCVSQPVQRLVSLSPGATELLYSAGAGDQVLAVSAWSDYPPQAATLPQVGDSNRLDLEAIVALSPDLVVAWVDGNSRAQLEKLAAIGIKVFWLAPRSFEDIARAVEDLALLTGRGELGRQRAEEFRREIRRLQSQFAEAPPIDVFYQVWDHPLMTVNREELISKAVTLCGGNNVFGHLSRLVPRVTIEAVVAANPEVILTAGTGENDRRWLDRWQRFPEITAVDRGNLFLEPPSLLQRPTFRMLEGTRHLCQTLERARANL